MSLHPIDTDAHMTLAEALAFIDESLQPDSIDVNWSEFAPHPSSQECYYSNSATRRSPNTRDTTATREAELLQQRVVELEKKQQEYEDAAFEMTMPGRRNGLLFDGWKRLANKYQELRREAETENRQLCAIYARHVATIEMLRRLLQLHEQAKKIPRSRQDISFTLTLTRRCVPRNHDTTPRKASTSCMLRPTARIIPFDYKAVGNASWHEMTKNYVRASPMRTGRPQPS
ncbi:hypothetical protein GQ600_23750 [Phytophthora cactorum]|nr:hypothetical protein GQ600_23750 [Phytophthora cactorum]